MPLWHHHHNTKKRVARVANWKKKHEWLRCNRLGRRSRLTETALQHGDPWRQHLALTMGNGAAEFCDCHQFSTGAATLLSERVGFHLTPKDPRNKIRDRAGHGMTMTSQHVLPAYQLIGQHRPWILISTSHAMIPWLAPLNLWACPTAEEQN